MVIDFHTKRELDLDVAAIRADHFCRSLQMAHNVNHHGIAAITETQEPSAEIDSSERLRQLAARLRHLASDMRSLQNGCLEAMNSAEWRR